jgi:SAM-dependent methyltransferase
MDSPKSHYIHGTDADEQRRLSLLNDWMNRASLDELALGVGERILDLGSGLGQFTRAMARVVGDGGQVVGVERSGEQLAAARVQARLAGEEDLVEFREGDAFAPPLREEEWGSFDVAHTRFLLEHVPDPAAVVRTMTRAVRPGGRIVLADDDHGVIRLWPEPPGFGPLWHAYIRTYDRLGNDPYVGRRLVSLLHEAGAAPRRNTWIFFGNCAGAAAFDLTVENLVSVVRGARQAIVSNGLLDPGLFDEAIGALRDWGNRPDAAVWYAIAWAEGLRPA